MKNQTLIGIAAGAAALAVAGVMFTKRKQAARSEESATRSDEYKSKLNHLQRKAQKEFKEAAADGTNPAIERVNQWANNS